MLVQYDYCAQFLIKASWQELHLEVPITIFTTRFVEVVVVVKLEGLADFSSWRSL